MSRVEKQRRRQQRKERKFQRELRRDRQDFLKLYADLAADSPRQLSLLSYDITYDAVPPHRSSLDDALSADEIEQLYHRANEDPAAAIPTLNELHARFPDSPILLNWLDRCHSFLGNEQEAEVIARLNYERNPDYLFAKVNMAQFALKRGELDQVAAIFDHKFDLKLLYPHRNEFHVSEYLAFAGIMVEYFMRTGEHEAAQMIFETMQEIDPDHEMTVRLRELLESSLLLLAFRRLLGLFGRKRRGRERITSGRSTPPRLPADTRRVPG